MQKGAFWPSFGPFWGLGSADLHKNGADLVGLVSSIDKSTIIFSRSGGVNVDRYYVQRTGESYLVRELSKPGDAPSANDPIICSFGRDGQEDAHTYARSANTVQRRLDALHGQWVKHAVLPTESQAHPS